MTATRAPLAALLLATLVAMLWGPRFSIELHILLEPTAASQPA